MVTLWLASASSAYAAEPPEPPSPVAPPPFHDKCDRQDRSAKFRVTLRREAELNDLVEWMMSVSCQKFIWAPGLRTKKVTIVAPEPVTLEEAYAAFFAALQTIGATVEPAGDYYKIVETTTVATADLPVYGPGAKVPDDDRYVTKVFRPPPEVKADAASLLEGLKTTNGSVTVVGDVVVITDTGARIRRLEGLLEDLGAVAGEQRKIFLYGVQHGDAAALAEVVRSVFAEGVSSTTAAPTPSATPKQGKAGKRAEHVARSSAASRPTTGPSIVVDERTGTLVLVATDDEYAPIRRLLDELDRAEGAGKGTLHVIQLEHADAVEVEAVLTKLAGASKEGERPGAPAGQPGTAVTGDVAVTAHAATQTLIVRASMSDFAAVKRVVDRIDRQRRQLYIEVYLLEVRAQQGLELGVGGHFGHDTPGGGVGFVNSSPGGANAALPSADGTGSAALLTGLSAGLLGPALAGSGELLGIGRDLPAFGITLQALETQSDINIVAEPHLYAAENEEASAEFGETVPVQGGTGTLPGSQTATFSQVLDKEITLKLKVTPHVADDETVSLDVVLEDRQLGQKEAAVGSYRTLTRKLDVKKVIAHPGQPVVLGGLTREVEDIVESQVPGLGRVPLIGWLFKKRGRRKEKVSLLMIMVPHIIDTPDDARRVHERRLAERMEFLERYTAFKRKDLETHVNYRKKSGLLASVNVAAGRQARDAELTAAAQAELRTPRVEAVIDPSAK